jgi:predicted enzyme related to lactoylglutathione lyase
MGQPVTQFQILAKNPERAAKFYGALFGWTSSTDNPLGYHQIHTGADRGINGGIWQSPPEGHSFVQLFVEVDDVAKAAADAVALGGGVIIPPQELPGGEAMAILRDPEGVPFAAYKPR